VVANLTGGTTFMGILVLKQASYKHEIGRMGL